MMNERRRTSRHSAFIIHHSSLIRALPDGRATACSVRADGVHDAAPDLEVHALDDFDGRVLVVFGHQPDAPPTDSQALAAQRLIYARDDDVAVVGLDHAVND